MSEKPPVPDPEAPSAGPAPLARKIFRALTVLLGVFLAAIVALRLADPRRSVRARSSGMDAVRTAPAPLPDFALTDQSGRPFGSSDLRGKVWVADFIFTRCQGPCPLQTARMAALQEEFASAAPLRFVSFSVDPAFDTPAVLAEYAKRYGADPARWRFLTGPTETLYKLVREDFRLAVAREKDAAGSGQEVTHSLSFVLVDGEGRINGYFDGADEAEMRRLRERIRAAL